MFRLNKWGVAKSKIYQSSSRNKKQIEETGNFTLSIKEENLPLAK